MTGAFQKAGGESRVEIFSYAGLTPHATAMLTSFLGTMMIFLMVLPARNGFTFSDAWAAASRSAWEMSTGTLMTSRSLPLTWTGISRVSSISRAGLKVGQDW